MIFEIVLAMSVLISYPTSQNKGAEAQLAHTHRSSRATRLHHDMPSCSPRDNREVEALRYLRERISQLRSLRQNKWVYKELEAAQLLWSLICVPWVPPGDYLYRGRNYQNSEPGYFGPDYRYSPSSFPPPPSVGKPFTEAHKPTHKNVISGNEASARR